MYRALEYRSLIGSLLISSYLYIFGMFLGIVFTLIMNKKICHPASQVLDKRGCLYAARESVEKFSGWGMSCSDAAPATQGLAGRLERITDRQI